MNQYTPLHYESVQCTASSPWSDPVGARQLRAKALRRRAPLCSDYDRRAVAPELTPLRLLRAL